MSITIGRVRPDTPPREPATYSPPPAAPDPLEDPNPWVRIAYYKGIDWAREQRTGYARAMGWQPPVEEWARWCESYYLSIMRGYRWTPDRRGSRQWYVHSAAYKSGSGQPDDSEGSTHLTAQQQEVGDGVSRGLTLATRQLYPHGTADPATLAIAAQYQPPEPQQRGARHGPHHHRP